MRRTKKEDEKMKKDSWQYKAMSNYELHEIIDRYGYDKSQKAKAKGELNKRDKRMRR